MKKEKVLDPNDPKVFTDPEKVRRLDPRQQMIAAINMAKTGQLVGGDQTRTIEAILKSAGYDVQYDGMLSAEEQAFLQHFKERLEDKALLTEMSAMAGMIAESVSAEGVHEILSMFIKKDPVLSKDSPGLLSGHNAGRLISDPD